MIRLQDTKPQMVRQCIDSMNEYLRDHETFPDPAIVCRGTKYVKTMRMPIVQHDESIDMEIVMQLLVKLSVAVRRSDQIVGVVFGTYDKGKIDQLSPDRCRLWYCSRVGDRSAWEGRVVKAGKSNGLSRHWQAIEDNVADFDLFEFCERVWGAR